MDKPIVKIYNKEIYKINHQHGNEYRRILIAYNRVVAYETEDGTIANQYYIVNDKQTLKAFKDFINQNGKPLQKLLNDKYIKWIYDMNQFLKMFNQG